MPFTCRVRVLPRPGCRRTANQLQTTEVLRDPFRQPDQRRKNLPPSRPTVVFFLGLSEALTVQVAEALALDLHRTYGISSRIVTPAAPYSDLRNFDELNTPKVSPLAKSLFRLSEHLQLGLLGYDNEYRFDLPELYLRFLAYDVNSDAPPAPYGPLLLESQEITIDQQVPPESLL